MRYGSVCSGIEAASVAWRPLGWKCAFVSEIEKFPSAVLAHRFPEIPNLGDFTKINPSDYEGDIDLLVGGTPCQAFSIAGLRKGLNDERGNLALEFAKLAFRTHARWVVWENVPGVLSSGKGCDFASFLSLLVGWEVRVPDAKKWRKAGLVTGAPGCFNVGWRVLDAQYTRVSQFPRAIPQRRKRVILVGSLVSWQDCAKVLFDGEMCGGDTPPRREAICGASSDSHERAEGSGGLTWWDGSEKADTITTRSIGQLMPDKQQFPCVIDTRWHTVADDGTSPSLLATDYKEPKAVVDPAPTLDASYPAKMNNQDIGKLVVESVQASACYPIDMMNVDGRGDEFKAKCYGKSGEAAYSLTRRRPSGVCTPGVIRRYIPLEAERLMGFPDGWTLIPWRGKPASECPDGPRYKALGNSMCTNVMAWIGERIHAVEMEKRNGREEA